jgi:hypothetical protein
MPVSPFESHAIPEAAANHPLRNLSTAASLPIILTIILLTLFMPVELSFYIFGLRLTVIRLIFIIISPFLFFKFAQKVATGQYRFVLSDLFFAFAGFWMLLAPTVIDGLLPSLNHAGPLILEFLVSYLATRTLLSKHGQALLFIDRLCIVIAFVCLLSLLDPITDEYYIKYTAAQLTGYPTERFREWGDAHRLGLLRASGPVEHPILLGFISAGALLFIASLKLSWRWFTAIACTLGLVFALSSAPIQVLLIGFALLLYGRLTAGIPFRWIALPTLTGLAILPTFAIGSPLGFILSNLIFDAKSGYYRYMTWQSVMAYVSQSPWFGLGFEVTPEEINHSIDALWLVLSIQYGYAGAILTAIALMGASSISTSGKGVSLTDQETRLGTVLGVFSCVTILMAFTVHLWGSEWVLTGLLAGTRAHLGELGRMSPALAPHANGTQQPGFL